MNRKYTLRWAISIIVLVGIFSVNLLALPKAAGATSDTGTPTPSFSGAWKGQFVLKSGVPFLWMRYAPTSDSPVIMTLNANDMLVAAENPDGPSMKWDGVQWWGYISMQTTTVFGWVELNRLQSSSGVSPTPAPTGLAAVKQAWAVPMVVRVKASIPFVWLRLTASSFEGAFTTLPTQAQLTIANSAARADATQWWWLVKDRATGSIGWVEQNSLELVSNTTVTESAAPTAQPWSLASTVRVRAVVPYSLVRSYYSSWAAALCSVNSGGQLDLVGAAQFDGVQWWWKVKDHATGNVGWVEQNSLEPVAGAVVTVSAAPTAQPWSLFTTVRVRAAVPYSLVRNYYSSWAAALCSVNSGGQLDVVGKPQFDGVQWWWQVKDHATGNIGWVEQNSLEPVTGTGTDSGASATFSANPNPVAHGGALTLTWNIPGASSVNITRLSENGGIYLESIGTSLPGHGSLNYTIPDKYVQHIPFILLASNQAPQTITVSITCPFAQHLTSVCPLKEQSIQAAYEQFENGYMIWRGDTHEIYVLFNTRQSYEVYPDTWVEGETIDVGTATPPAGRTQPVRGIGKVWATGHSPIAGTNPSGVRDRIGWALAAETAYTMSLEVHPHDWDRPDSLIFTLPDGKLVSLYDTGWQFVN